MAHRKRVKLPVIHTGAATAAYCWVTKPDDKFNPDKPDYKITLVMDPDEAEALKASILKEAMAPATEQGFKKLTRQIKDGSAKLPIQDGDERNQDRKDKDIDIVEAFVGKVLVTFKSKFAPKLFIPKDLQEAYSAQDREVWIMSGDVVKVKAEVNPYDGLGGGVSLRLKAVKLIEKMAGLEDNSGFGDDDDDEYVTAKPSGRSRSSDNDDDEDEDDDY